ncbi:MAG: SprB repeat-containing protein [Acidobacteriota bacterium]
MAEMSTEVLLDAVLDYPLFSQMLAHNNMQRGFETLSESFNGLQELRNRPDAPETLLAAYQSLDPARIGDGWSLLQQGKFAFRVYYLEMLLAQDWLVWSLGHLETQALLAETLTARDQKLERFDVYGAFGLERTALVTGKALGQADPSFAAQELIDPALAKFLTTANYASPWTMDLIFDRAEELLQGESSWSPKDFGLIEPFATKDYNSTVTTPNGSSVPVIVMTWEFTAGTIAAANDEVEAMYPLAVRETNASRKYNCHSYAFYSSSTSNNRWMNTPGDDTYWLDGSYIPLSTIVAGARVSYYGDHSAVAINASEFRSKWGSYPRMRHAPTYVPQSYGAVRQAYFRNNFRVNLTGPTSRNPNQSGTWTATVSSGVPPYSYSWFKSTSSGITDLSSTCTSTSSSCSSSTSDTQSFNIVVDVIDSTGRFATDYVFVDVDGDPDGPGGGLPF